MVTYVRCFVCVFSAATIIVLQERARRQGREAWGFNGFWVLAFAADAVRLRSVLWAHAQGSQEWTPKDMLQCSVFALSGVALVVGVTALCYSRHLAPRYCESRGLRLFFLVCHLLRSLTI